MADEPNPASPDAEGMTPAEAAHEAANPSELRPSLGGKFDISEEFGTADKKLPPLKILGIAAGAVVVVVAVMALIQRPTSSTTGTYSDVVSVAVPDQKLLMVAVNVSVVNKSDKPYWVRTIDATLETAGGSFNDEAASAADFERYFQAMPDLKQHAMAPLRPETKIEAGGQAAGTVIVSFPVTAQDFAGRKSLTVTIHPYDQPVPLMIKQ
ncbi:MAG TPA: hypothetical protein VF753_19330 [Terriglobales bacterium]